ncbi:MAG: alpha-amylase [Phormidesmis sp.]
MLNGTILQCFHSCLPAESGSGLAAKASSQLSFWQQLAQSATELANVGFSALWLPPMTKGSDGAEDSGYSAYDLYDLGEFDQCGSVATKYGDRAQLLSAIAAIQSAGLQVYGDVVLHRKHGGDGLEKLEVTPVSWREPSRATGPAQEILARSRFDFPNRTLRYSDMTWRGEHFQRVNHNYLASDKEAASLYRIKLKAFSSDVDVRLGKQAQASSPVCELDLDMSEVAQALNDWGQWLLETTRIDGLRIDGVKYVPANYVREWIQQLRAEVKRTPQLFVMGDCWSDQVNDLHWYIAKSGGELSLFDVPLHYNFHYASRQGGYYDLRTIFKGTLVQEQPALAVTFVENHDSQPFQLLESPVDAWFKPLAYALILLRQEGYPCVFAGDYYGANCTSGQREVRLPAYRWLLDRLLFARSHCAYGDQYDYFEQASSIGWTRLGDSSHPQAMAVVMSNADDTQQWMEVGKPSTQFTDITQHLNEPVWTNSDGWGQFGCRGSSVSVWVEVG